MQVDSVLGTVDMTNTSHDLLGSGIWQSDVREKIPATDIITFAFERINQLDQDAPIYLDAKDSSKFLTAHVVHEAVKQLAVGFRGLGLKPGQCVCIHTFNHILYPIFWLSIIAAGGVVTGSNPASTIPELVHQFNITNTEYVIVHEDCRGTALEAASRHGLPLTRTIVFDDEFVAVLRSITSTQPIKLDEDQVGPILMTSIWALGRDESQHPISNEYTPGQSQIAVYATTSGTTGLPKAALISHQYIVSQAFILERALHPKTSQVSQLVCLPVFHAFAAQLALILPLRLIIPTYFLPRFKLDDFVKAVRAHAITETAIVPTIASVLLTLNDACCSELASLQYITCAGAPLNPKVQQKLFEKLPSSPTIAQCWGATETGWATMFSRHEKDFTGSVGHLLPNTQLKIINPDTGSVLRREGDVGEAYIKSQSLFTGYRANEVANVQAFDKDGFYRTGDRVFYQAGKLYVLGRTADTIKVNGWQVSPEELETILNQHPMIADSAVIGIQTRDAQGIDQMLPKAYVVRKAGCIMSQQDVKSFVASKVIAYKNLTGGVAFVSNIPRNSTGKILRRLLVTEAERTSEYTSSCTHSSSVSNSPGRFRAE